MGFLELLLLLDLWQRFNGSVRVVWNGPWHGHSLPKVSNIGTAKKTYFSDWISVLLSFFVSCLPWLCSTLIDLCRTYTPPGPRPEFADQLEMRDAAFTRCFGQNCSLTYTNTFQGATGAAHLLICLILLDLFRSWAMGFALLLHAGIALASRYPV